MRYRPKFLLCTRYFDATYQWCLMVTSSTLKEIDSCSRHDEWCHLFDSTCCGDFGWNLTKWIWGLILLIESRTKLKLNLQLEWPSGLLQLGSMYTGQVNFYQSHFRQARSSRVGHSVSHRFIPFFGPSTQDRRSSDDYIAYSTSTWNPQKSREMAYCGWLWFQENFSTYTDTSGLWNLETHSHWPVICSSVILRTFN